MNTSEEKTTTRIYEIKSWLIEHDKKYDNSSINEKRVKLQLELKQLDEKHVEDPFVRVGKNGMAANE